MTDWLIETDDLATLLETEPDADRVVLDCSWYLPETGKHAIEDFRAGHIPGARFIDLADISDPESDYVNMMPSPERFADAVGAAGIGNGTEVIVYDAGYVSARLWWMFRTFGHNRVRILNGGYRKWVAEGRPLEDGPARDVPRQDFVAGPVEGRVASIETLRDVTANGGAAIIDARTAAKFDGLEGSGYPGVASGYMPGAINTPWQLFFRPAPDHRFVSADEARRIFEDRGVDMSGPVITTCGSGVTASILGFMLEQVGHADWTLYDGSWHEWGQQPDTPKLVKGDT
ncbi:sulfurtransferase [Roseisalinus antarcticus]|uniref:3-mercaptopyruvate sulfurtransferase n=1 Tax=Roseisalinus antarcticus TaxID=254357 RepID=A0A1Y5TUY2_9RHOB|nr:sulfurtransferase [Roseisalinus antarcticus]SLN73672.1 3-mercaptopyruvate sulfurtransferase [Roseisalinus antarcticus]